MESDALASSQSNPALNNADDVGTTVLDGVSGRYHTLKALSVAM